MKFTAKLFLLSLIIPLLLLGLISASVKFQILSSRFWLTTFEKYNVYTSMASALKSYAEGQIEKEGGSKADAKVLTDLATPDNLKDLTGKNIVNFLSYANGQATELLVYLPVKKLPKDLLPKNYANLPEEVEINTLLSKYGINAVSRTQIQQFSLAGRATTYFMVLDLTLSAIFIFLLFILTDSGHRFIFPGLALVITGILVLLIFRGGVMAQTGASSAEVIYMSIIPPVIKEISRTWIIAGVAFLISGGVLFFFKKR